MAGFIIGFILLAIILIVVFRKQLIALLHKDVQEVEKKINSGFNQNHLVWILFGVSFFLLLAVSFFTDYRFTEALTVFFKKAITMLLGSLFIYYWGTKKSDVFQKVWDDAIAIAILLGCMLIAIGFS